MEPPSVVENESNETSRVSSVACDRAIRGFLRGRDCGSRAESALLIGGLGRDPLPSELGNCTVPPICFQPLKQPNLTEIRWFGNYYVAAASNDRSVMPPSLASNHSIVLRSP